MTISYEKKFLAAVREGFMRDVKSYIKLGVDVNCNDGEAFRIAVREDNVNMFALLQKNNKLDTTHEGLLVAATIKNNKNFVKRLFPYFKDNHVEKENAMRMACGFTTNEMRKQIKKSKKDEVKTSNSPKGV